MAQFQFNATQYEPRYSGGDTLGPGKHIVTIVESDFRPTKDSTPNDPRSMLVLKMAAQSGGSITDRLNIQNPNQQTVQIAYGQLAAYCAVVGRQGFNDTQELHSIPFMIEVAPQKARPEYMEVVGVYFADGSSANSPASVQQFVPAAQPAPAVAQPAAPFGGAQSSAPFAPTQAAGAPQWNNATVGAASTQSPSSPQPAPFQPGATPPWQRR